MPHHRLMLLRITVALRLDIVEDFTNLLLLIFGQQDVPRRNVLFQALWFRSSGDRNHALRNHPRKRDLGESAALALSQGLDGVDDTLVVVEVLALELGDWEVGYLSMFVFRDAIEAIVMLSARTHLYGGSHPVQSLQGSYTESHLPATHVREGCTLRRRR